MRINADFSEPVIVNRSETEWVLSPESGVDRIMLDRIGDEVARATSIVRYAPGSSFARHEHAKGEEFLVLEGTFSDDSGDYPAGFYVRNPPGSGHSPYSKDGCRILVKLRQFDPQDLIPVVIDTRQQELWFKDEEDDPSWHLPLHQYESERVQMLRIAADTQYAMSAGPHGTELFIVTGAIKHGDEELPAESWLRFPADQSPQLLALTDTVLWVKRGHLPD
jgi:anti-sigma factor ChrR (cupin superfamily)